MNAIKQLQWNQWFAGIIEGDGCFYINKKNEISFELITHIRDSRIVYNVKDKLKAGAVKLRSGSLSIRYRVKQRSTIINIIDRVNGKLYNPARLKNFKQACTLLNINFISPVALIQKENAYLAGLFDSDGTIAISVSKTNQLNSQKPGVEGQITILTQSRGYNSVYLRLTSINKENLLLIVNCYKFGKIHLEKANLKNKSAKRKYECIINSYEDFIIACEYFKKKPLKSVKMHRIRLVLLYFQYKKLKYDLKPYDTPQYKIWAKFCRSWFKYMH